MSDFTFPRLLHFDGQNRLDGHIRFLSTGEDFDFDVKRVFWISGVPENAVRGVHAHKKEEQLLVAISGTLIIDLEDKSGIKSKFVLDEPSKGLFIPAMHWSSVEFAHDAILLGLGNMPFDEEDYIRDKDAFDQA
ncbi:FdtA/QdtA family cupin domain-containing protein [Belliella sp. DSM 111904]|uniref:FdtA/QdtA family cupin domain-containing protein n=1 Tax=Belliella filtrata TaxID=2923435 RepID=A0ABS9UVW4_9BACT|nr:FdtA/QdtA family cupin domain-containing protein [Belliella filtrata]MCH7408303.1 FdtA/QdtA family cupin domain-containing protein [Belliella filtrata]